MQVDQVREPARHVVAGLEESEQNCSLRPYQKIVSSMKHLFSKLSE